MRPLLTCCHPPLQIVADDLGLLALHDSEGGHPPEAAAAADAAAHAALRHEQPMPPQPAPPIPAAPQSQPTEHHEPASGPAAPDAQRPRATASAEQSRQMYEGEGLPLDAIAARRGIKASTVVDHLLATAAAGTFSLSSWARLAAEVGLGQEGGPLLSPAEVALAIAGGQSLWMPAAGRLVSGLLGTYQGLNLAACMPVACWSTPHNGWLVALHAHVQMWSSSTRGRSWAGCRCVPCGSSWKRAPPLLPRWLRCWHSATATPPWSMDASSWCLRRCSKASALVC